MARKNIDDIINWNPDIFSDRIFQPYATPAKATYDLYKKRLDVVFNTMRNLESLPITIPTTDQILSGDYEEDISPDVYLRVRNFAKAFDDLCASVKSGIFQFTKSDACYIHEIAASHDVENASCGCFRRDPVRLGTVAWFPPAHGTLDNLWKNGEKTIGSMNLTWEKGVIAFLWMSRCQFFADCNKRTASLMANGILASSGCRPLLFKETDQENFMINLAKFYETGNADKMIETLASYIETPKLKANSSAKAKM